MALYTIIKFKNLTPIHLGTGKENYDFSAATLQSDTISAALAALRAQLGNADNLDSFLNSFAISSAFPFWGETLFLPKGIGKVNIQINNREESSYRKEIKKLKFIELNMWLELMSGKSIVAEKEQLKGSFFLAKENLTKYQKPFSSQVNQRVTVPRDDNNEATPFFFDWTYFKKDAGLYCITDAKGALLNEIVSLFKILGENGLGTDKNIGGGKFDVETKEVEISSPKNADAIILLSLYTPTEEELSNLQLSDARYDLLVRGGYMAGSQEEDFRHLRKKSIYMFSVGSIFPTTQPLNGKIVNLAPAWNDQRMHPVWRSGKPFCIPIKQ